MCEFIFYVFIAAVMFYPICRKRLQCHAAKYWHFSSMTARSTGMAAGKTAWQKHTQSGMQQMGAARCIPHHQEKNSTEKKEFFKKRKNSSGKEKCML